MSESENDLAIALIKGGAAHSDIGTSLHLAAKNIADAEWISGDRADFPAAGVMRNGQIFAFVEGMQYVTLRLSEPHTRALLRLGGTRHPSFASGNWVNVTPWNDELNLPAWLHKAYDAAEN